MVRDKGPRDKNASRQLGAFDAPRTEAGDYATATSRVSCYRSDVAALCRRALSPQYGKPTDKSKNDYARLEKQSLIKHLVLSN